MSYGVLLTSNQNAPVSVVSVFVSIKAAQKGPERDVSSPP